MLTGFLIHDNNRGKISDLLPVDTTISIVWNFEYENYDRLRYGKVIHKSLLSVSFYKYLSTDSVVKVIKITNRLMYK